jgi:hypothetical protein
MITINMDKAKEIAHNLRREKREEEFAPLDAIIMKQIPGQSADSVEQQRQAIRDKYAVMQNDINAAQAPQELKNILGI